MATIPPPLNTHALTHQNPFQNTNNILQQQAQYEIQQSSCQPIKTILSHSVTFNFNKLHNFHKLELKTKNYNPFDNNTILTEVRNEKK